MRRGKARCLLNMDERGKLRLYDGDYIPNMPNVITLREKVQRCYDKGEGQSAKDGEDGCASQVVTPEPALNYSYVAEDPGHGIGWLANEFDEGELDEERLGQYEENEGKDDYTPCVTVSVPFSKYSCVEPSQATAWNGIDPDVLDVPELKSFMLQKEDLDQYWLGIKEKIDAPVLTTESLSHYSLTAEEQARRNKNFEWDPGLTGLLEAQSEPEQVKGPSKRWSDMVEEEDEDIPMEFTGLWSDSSPPSFVSNNPVFQVDW